MKLNQLKNDDDAKSDDVPETTESEAQADSSVQYSCSPINRLKLGQYQFADGILTVDSEDVDHFEQLLEGCPPHIKSQVQRINVDRAAEIAKQHAKINSSMSAGVSTTGDDLPA